MTKAIIYIVDDDAEVRESMCFLLRSLGHTCHGYASGKDFLGSVLTLEPGCILLDFRMGGLTGLQVLSEIRWLELDWPVVIMTGHGDASVAAKALALGAIEFLEKPFGHDLLANVLDRASIALAASAKSRSDHDLDQLPL